MQIRDGRYIIPFLKGTEKDYKGRTYGEMLKWSDVELERCHDQVQHCFPLHEGSKSAKTYPVLTKEVVEEAKQDEDVLNNLRKGADRFSRFFGIGKYSDVHKQKAWCRFMDHNLLRITRIIRSLRLFGLDKEAKEFYESAVKAGNNCGIDNITQDYWSKAMNDPIWDSLR